MQTASLLRQVLQYLSEQGLGSMKERLILLSSSQLTRPNPPSAPVHGSTHLRWHLALRWELAWLQPWTAPPWGGEHSPRRQRREGAPRRREGPRSGCGRAHTPGRGNQPGEVSRQTLGGVLAGDLTPGPFHAPPLGREEVWAWAGRRPPKRERP